MMSAKEKRAYVNILLQEQKAASNTTIHQLKMQWKK